MEVSNCKDCKAALKRALIKGDDPAKLKMIDGHLPGCPSLSPPQPSKEASDAVRRPETAAPQARPQEGVWPWAEGQYQIRPVTVPQPRQGGQDRGGLPGSHAPTDEPAGGAGGQPRAPQPSRRGSADHRQSRGRAYVRGPDHASSYAAVAAEHGRKREHVHQFKVVDHANSGEQRDHRKGVWFVLIVLAALLTVPFFPPLALLYIGMGVMLFVMR